MRKRGKFWNAQVSVSGWKSFIESFSKKSDAVIWIKELEHKLRSVPLPDVIIDSKVTLKELLLKYAEEISSTHKECKLEICRLKSFGRRWIGELDTCYLTKQYFIEYRDDRVRVVKGGSVKSELLLIKSLVDTATKNWRYPIPNNPSYQIDCPKGSSARTRRLISDETNASSLIAKPPFLR